MTTIAASNVVAQQRGERGEEQTTRGCGADCQAGLTAGQYGEGKSSCTVLLLQPPCSKQHKDQRYGHVEDTICMLIGVRTDCCGRDKGCRQWENHDNKILESCVHGNNQGLDKSSF